MNCGRVSNQLSAYLDQELSGMEMLQIRSHLSSCDRCRAEQESLRRMKLLLGRLRSIEPPPVLREAAVRRFEQTGGRPQAPRSWLESGPAVGVRRLGGRPCPGYFVAVAGRWLLDSIPWQRLAVGLTTAALAAALIFTNVVLRRHSDALVASTPSLVLEGRQDQLETPPFVEAVPGYPAPHDVFQDRRAESQSSLSWVNVSLQGESSWSFR